MSLLNPLHPGTLFIQKQRGKQFLYIIPIIMPPFSSVTFQVGPQAGLIWISAVGCVGTPRDVTTGNPVYSALIYLRVEQPMVRTYNFYGLESALLNQWGMESDISSVELFTATIVNGTALTVTWDWSIAIMEVPERLYDEYLRLWNGLYNFLYLLGGFTPKQIDALIDAFKEREALRIE